MDYIGENYLDRAGKSITYNAVYLGLQVDDVRTVTYGQETGVMTIYVDIWETYGLKRKVGSTYYQKAILGQESVKGLFEEFGVVVSSVDKAFVVNPYYTDHSKALGMISNATWWLGEKTVADQSFGT